MPQVTQRKARTPGALVFDALESFTFPMVTLAPSQANTAIQQYAIFPTTGKIYRVVALVTGTVAGTCSLNIVAGTAAEAGTGTPDTRENGANAYPIPVAPAGTQLFTADQPITMTAGALTQLDVPADLFDVVFKGIVTLRLVTSAGATGSLYISGIRKFTDINPPQGAYGSINQVGYTGQGSFTPAIALP